MTQYERIARLESVLRIRDERQRKWRLLTAAGISLGTVFAVAFVAVCTR